MKLKVFEIILTNNDCVYYSGQTLQGHVILELEKRTKVSGIRLFIRGKAFVHWTEQTMRGPGESRHKETRHHSATEDYFDVSQPLLTKATETGQPEEKRILDAGQYTYPFTFVIPQSAPSSFEGKYGFVRYWVKVTVERHWKEDVSVKKLFSVVCPVDLNREPPASQPTHNKKEKRLCCLCCTSGPITADLSLSHRGFVAGEKVYISADVKNRSRRKIGSTSVELLMTTTFYAQNKSRSVTEQVASLHHGALSPGKTDCWEEEQFVIPPLPPSFMIGCSIMDVKYTLELRVFPVGPAFELAVPVEIIIGTVPLNSTIDNFIIMHQMTPPTPRNVQRSALKGAAPVFPDNNHIPALVPSSFSKSPMCHFHLRDDEDDQRTIMESFTPKFLYYNFQVIPQRRNQTVRFAT
ncbi:arrestin domain-containing protein 3-like isoform X2 [Physella acuta]|uniref:arrestin domain-containing protein 3-like isoform X2 n=1 Tax=Physella acuta TaxID=109671 RepID=UPI0027DCAE7A|nr:arrestin domain-containing protein 3-like isoform X2 [Physella acuta]